MADSEISNLPAVTTPASTDELAVAQGGDSKKVTRAQMHTLESGEHLVLPQVDEVATPTLAFGDGDTGVQEILDDVLEVVIAGATHAVIDGTWLFRGHGTAEPGLINENSSATNPTVLPIRNDANTGLGSAGPDQLSLIAGGVEGQRISEVSSAIMHSYQADSGLTAHTDSVQGAGVILSSYNVYSTVGTTGDAATLPAAFTDDPATVVHVKNDGANSMDVFPASGDNAGAGTDTAVAVAAGAFAVFMGTTANATWTKIMGGTA